MKNVIIAISWLFILASFNSQSDIRIGTVDVFFDRDSSILKVDIEYMDGFTKCEIVDMINESVNCKERRTYDY